MSQRLVGSHPSNFFSLLFKASFKAVITFSNTLCTPKLMWIVKHTCLNLSGLLSTTLKISSIHFSRAYSLEFLFSVVVAPHIDWTYAFYSPCSLIWGRKLLLPPNSQRVVLAMWNMSHGVEPCCDAISILCDQLRILWFAMLTNNKALYYLKVIE